MGDYKFYWYIAAWVDLLGQSQELAQFHDIPTSETQKREFIEKARRTFGVVRRFRDRMLELQTILSKPLSLPSATMAVLSKDDLKLFKRYSSPNVDIKFLSDSALLTICLHEGEKWSPLLSIDFLLSQLAITTLAMLAHSTPVRGGMAIGICSKLAEGDLYGKAVSRAHELEKAAGYPRIMIDAEFPEYIEWYQSRPASGREKRLIDHHIESIKAALRRDEDGLALSYLDRVRKIRHDEEHKRSFQEVTTLASDFIAREIEKFRSAGDTKLLPRYEKLKAYFEQEGCWKPSI